jgi:predicted NBD/HSP70 family sugar kinase
MAPPTRARANRGLGPGYVLQLIREHEAATRSELIARTGLGRSTIYQRVDTLIASGLVCESGEAPSTGGRPASTLRFNADSGLALVADLGVTHSRVAVTDLEGSPRAERTADLRIDTGPENVLAWVLERFDELLVATKSAKNDVRAIGVGVPGPVEYASGRPVSPPLMPGWDGYDIPARLHDRYPVPTLVDNDVNIMALGEHSAQRDKGDNLLFVKLGSGIGCGIVAGREMYRGEDGAAGDIGHIPLNGFDDVRCHCGNTGCLEAVAGGQALARAAADLGLRVKTTRDLVAHVAEHDPKALRLARQAGRHVGEVLAGLVNALNPAVIVIGGDLAAVPQEVFAGVREVVYQRSTALATRTLQIVPSLLGDRAGITGAAIMATEHVLAPEVLDRRLGESAASAEVA